MNDALVAKVDTFDPSVPDNVVADTLNTKDPALPKRKVKVPVSDARAVLMISGSWGPICIIADKLDADTAIRALCITVRDAMTTLSTIDTDVPETYTSVNMMLQGLLGAGLITGGTYDKLTALSDSTQSWADINLGTSVTSRDVGIARGGKE